MGETLWDQFGETAVRAFVVIFAGLFLLSTVADVQQQGLTALPTALIGMYVIGLTGWAGFYDGLEDPRFRVLLALGLVAWGGVDIVRSQLSTTSIAFVSLGAGLLGLSAWERRRDE
ncbi:MAG: hypothetical protein J07HR59_00792 [Halorubrum sp. J07HR59]|nr:MAG: hypothetical protein J07HR59_00792 [Halorubrum sp. J07HR59]